MGDYQCAEEQVQSQINRTSIQTVYDILDSLEFTASFKGKVRAVGVTLDSCVSSRHQAGVRVLMLVAARRSESSYSNTTRWVGGANRCLRLFTACRRKNVRRRPRH